MSPVIAIVELLMVAKELILALMGGQIGVTSTLISFLLNPASIQ